ncbi:MAG: molybdopterin-guanine dinucleotide biosynthesis protein B [bacterium]|jgi:molybdopterin-guanine dinucleotide biosynthesis protein B
MAGTGTGNIIGIVGYKDSGKTGVVEGLIGYFRGRGFSVGTVKHIDHDSSIRPLGTDSKRHLDAGAGIVVAVGEKVVEVLKARRGDVEGGDLEATVAAYLSTCDLVIVEGFKQEAIPKVAMISDDAAILDETRNVVAVVSSGKRPDNVPGFGPDEIEKLGEHLLENEILGAAGKQISLVVDGKPVRLNEFVRTSLAGVIQGFITSLRDVEDPSTIELRIRK